MNEPLIVERCDARLLPFLEARDHSLAESLLIQLIQEHADPIVAKILKSKLRVSLIASHGTQENQDALEIASELRAILIADLRALQEHPDQKSIKSFPDYVSIKAYSACADYFRERNPRRWRLKNLLRYQLKQNSRFDLWQAEDNYWYAGLSEWSDMMSANPSALLPSSPSKLLERFPTKHAQDVAPAELLTAIFADIGQAIEFERLVTLAAEVWNIKDSAPEPVDSPDGKGPAELLTSSPRVDLLLEQRLYLEKLWTEVCQLPVLQRAALLLNLRDAQGGSAIFFIPHLCIATHAQIAAHLELPDEQFSALWNDLPLDDSRIATMLDISRQQVINLRKTARERLRRRMERPQSQKFT